MNNSYPWLQINNLEKNFTTRQGPIHTFSLRLLSKFKNIYLPGSISVLSNIDLTVLPGECIGIHGPNGSGKSTLLKCIAGVMHPSEGTITHNGITTALLTHGLGAYEDLPVWRNILLVQQLFGLSKAEALKNIDRIADIANLTNRLASPTTQLSEGMRAKISLVALFFATFDMLIIDESLNHVDAEFRNLFFNRSREWLAAKKSILITSHDPALLKHFSTRVLQISNGKLVPSNL